MNCKSHRAWKIFQQVIKYKLCGVMRGCWLSIHVCILSFLFAAFLPVLASVALEVLRGKGREFSASERGYKPRANENAKPNRDWQLISLRTAGAGGWCQSVPNICVHLLWEGKHPRWSFITHLVFYSHAGMHPHKHSQKWELNCTQTHAIIHCSHASVSQK